MQSPVVVVALEEISELTTALHLFDELNIFCQETFRPHLVFTLMRPENLDLAPILAIYDVRLGVYVVLSQCRLLWHCCMLPQG